MKTLGKLEQMRKNKKYFIPYIGIIFLIIDSNDLYFVLGEVTLTQTVIIYQSIFIGLVVLFL
jgi:hypothetical protein